MEVYEVYSSPGCTYCTQAYRLLEQNDKDYISYDIVEDEDALQLMRDNGFRTVPQIFCNGVYIGGFTDLAEHLKARKEG